MPNDLIRNLALIGLVLLTLGLATPAAADYGTGVTLFADKNFSGASYTFYDDVPYLKDTPFGHDRASSVRVISGCTVTLFSDAGYRGRTTTLTRDAYDLRGTEVGNDSISSLRIRCRRATGGAVDWSRRRGAALYSDDDFGGRREIFYDHDQDLRNNRIRNDSASSVQVAPGCRLTLYSDKDFRGRSTTVDYDTESLRNTAVGNDSVSSLRLSCDSRGDRRGDRHSYKPHRPGGHGGVTLYTDTEYRGRSEIFHGDVADLSDTVVGNDTVSSARIAPGCQLVLFEDAHYRGNSIVLSGDAPSLDGTSLGNDRASSIRTDCARHRYGRPRHGHSSPDYGRDEAHRGGVTLFLDNDFEGRNETFYRDIRNLDDTPIGNDNASSVRVAPGCRATLYRDSDFRGKSTVLTGDASSLQFTSVGNDNVSSMEVDCRRR